MPFETETIPPIRFLAELREECLQHSLKRMPKWKFRLASDAAIGVAPISPEGMKERKKAAKQRMAVP